jgi:hypothetical protein
VAYGLGGAAYGYPWPGGGYDMGVLVEWNQWRELYWIGQNREGEGSIWENYERLDPTFETGRVIVERETKSAIIFIFILIL